MAKNKTKNRKRTPKEFRVTVRVSADVELIVRGSHKKAKKIAEYVTNNMVIDNRVYADEAIVDVADMLDCDVDSIEEVE